MDGKLGHITHALVLDNMNVLGMLPCDMDHNMGQLPPCQNDSTVENWYTGSTLRTEAYIEEEKYASISPNIFGKSVEESPILKVGFQSPA